VKLRQRYYDADTADVIVRTSAVPNVSGTERQ
jgi:hypothetical protein